MENRIIEIPPIQYDKKNNDNTPILLERGSIVYLVHSIGKVASKSICSALKQQIDSPIYHLHYLNETTLKRMKKWFKEETNYSTNMPALIDGRSISNLLKKHKHSLNWKIITLIREPISWQISMLFEITEQTFPFLISNNNFDNKYFFNEIKKSLNNSIGSVVLNNHFYQNWWEIEFNSVFDFNIIELPFNTDKGWEIYCKENIEVLVVQYEKLKKVYNEAFCAFGLSKEICLPELNKTSNKPLGVYKPERIINDFKFDDLLINRLYENKVVKHFYNQQQLAVFKQRWSSQRVKINNIEHLHLMNQPDIFHTDYDLRLLNDDTSIETGYYFDEEIYEKVASIAADENIIYAKQLGDITNIRWCSFYSFPLNLPYWYLKELSNKSLNSEWINNIENCVGIFTFSESLKNDLVKKTKAAITSFIHPLPISKKEWSIDVYCQNDSKQIVQPRFEYCCLNAIFMLPQSKFKKILLATCDPIELKQELIFEQNYLGFEFRKPLIKTANIIFDNINNIENWYDGNIFFLHIYDCSYNWFILKCIADHVPVLINRIPAMHEYLGEDYPLYYSCYAEAIEKASNTEIIASAHNYLKERCVEPFFKLEYFLAKYSSFLSNI